MYVLGGYNCQKLKRRSIVEKRNHEVETTQRTYETMVFLEFLLQQSITSAPIEASPLP